MNRENFNNNFSIFLRTSAKVKLIALFLTSSLMFLFVDLYVYSLILAISICLVFSAGFSLKYLYNQLQPILILLALTLIGYLFVGDLVCGSKVVVRCIAIALLAFFVINTSTTQEMIEGLEELLKPLSFLVNPQKASLIISLTIRFIPLVAQVFSDVRTAQQARGLDNSFIAILIPALIKTLRMADNIAEAIESRS